MAGKQIFLQYFHLSACFSLSQLNMLLVVQQHEIHPSWQRKFLQILCCSTGNYLGDAGRSSSSSLLNSMFHHLHISHLIMPWFSILLPMNWETGFEELLVNQYARIAYLLHFISFADWVYSVIISAISDYVKSRHLWTFEVLHLWKKGFHNYFIKL